MSDEKPILLVNLVIARLKEEWPGHEIGSHHYKLPGEEYGSLFVDHIPLGEVIGTKVRLYIPHVDGYQMTRVMCHATDPKFFQEVCATVKLIMQRHQDAVDDALRGAKYFTNDGR